MNPKTKAIIEHYQFEKLPVEGTLYKSTHRSLIKYQNNGPIGSAIIGLYSDTPLSVSCFHKLKHEEIWHFYGGDPFLLHLLFPDGTTQEVIMGNDFSKNQKVQFVVPANVWQAGEMRKGGNYSLYGCTMAPGFIGTCFEAGIAHQLIEAYPNYRETILRLSVNGHETKMPDGFET